MCPQLHRCDGDLIRCLAGRMVAWKETANEGQSGTALVPILTRLCTRVAGAHAHVRTQSPHSPPHLKPMLHFSLPRSPDCRLVKRFTKYYNSLGEGNKNLPAFSAHMAGTICSHPQKNCFKFKDLP